MCLRNNSNFRSSPSSCLFKVWTARRFFRASCSCFLISSPASCIVFWHSLYSDYNLCRSCVQRSAKFFEKPKSRFDDSESVDFEKEVILSNSYFMGFIVNGVAMGFIANDVVVWFVREAMTGEAEWKLSLCGLVWRCLFLECPVDLTDSLLPFFFSNHVFTS